MSWHHAPIHRFTGPGRSILTAGTYHKQDLFRSRDALDRLQDAITFEMTNLPIALGAWSIFSNHYHLVVDAKSPRTFRSP